MVHNLPAPEGLESFRVRGENVGPVVLIGKNLTENAKDYQISAHTHTERGRWGLVGPQRADKSGLGR